MKIDTLLFDLDGTLIDTNELINQSFLYTFEQYGQTFSSEEIKSFNGPPLLDTFSKINKEKAEEMIAVYKTHNLQFHDEYVTAFPEVVETIKELKKAGMKMAIVSTKSKSSVHKGLDLVGLGEMFDAIITLDDVTCAKPHPEPIHKALELLGCDAEQALMVGDNYHDIEAGKNAGVATAAVAWSHKGEAFLQTYGPDFMLHSMKDLLDITGCRYAENR